MATVAERIAQYRADSANYRQQADVWRQANNRNVAKLALERFDEWREKINFNAFAHRAVWGDRYEFHFYHAAARNHGIARAYMTEREWYDLLTAYRAGITVERLAKAMDAADLRDTQADALK